jgi:hypothetical protein
VSSDSALRSSSTPEDLESGGAKTLKGWNHEVISPVCEGGRVAEDLPLQRKVTPEESGVRGARTPKGRSVGVHLSRLSPEDRCQ